MIKIRLNQLIREKQAEWRKDITYRELSKETGIAQSTLVRLRKGKTQRVDLNVLDSLCKYFKCRSINEILEYIPGDQPEGDGDSVS